MHHKIQLNLEFSHFSGAAFLKLSARVSLSHSHTRSAVGVRCGSTKRNHRAATFTQPLYPGKIIFIECSAVQCGKLALETSTLFLAIWHIHSLVTDSSLKTYTIMPDNIENRNLKEHKEHLHGFHGSQSRVTRQLLVGKGSPLPPRRHPVLVMSGECERRDGGGMAAAGGRSAFAFVCPSRRRSILSYLWSSKRCNLPYFTKLVQFNGGGGGGEENTDYDYACMPTSRAS